MRTQRATGPIIDQEGREVRPETLRGSRFDGAGPQFEFHTFGFNAAPLTKEQRFARLEAIGNLLDTAFIVPGTNVRYGLDGLIGLVPVIGDAFDVAFKANVRNIRLLRRWMDKQK
jgi:hypothetical protein